MYRTGLLAALVLTALLPGELRAQAHDGAIQRQRALLDSLIAERRLARQELERLDSLSMAERRARAVALDTAAIGPFVVVARTEESAEHFRNVTEAVAAHAPLLRGLDVPPVWLFVERDAGHDDALRYRASLHPGRHVRIFGGSIRLRTRFTRMAVVNALYEFVPPDIAQWLGDADLARGSDQRSIYRELATSSSPAVAACYRSAHGCGSALQLAGGVTDSLALSRAARASLLLHALQLGGPGSMARLRSAAHVTPAQALERAAQQPLARLLASWRAHTAAGYASHAGLVRASGAVLFWTLVALLFSLRSARGRAD